jgi:hypothetical protein
MGRRWCVLALTAFLALAGLAGCARDDSDTDRGRFGGFYSGVSGAAHP